MTENSIDVGVSVVIPAHNAAGTILEQLDALRSQDSDSLSEVIVVDSVSTDETRAVVQCIANDWPKVRIVTAVSSGANVARNTGVAATSSVFLLLCDADDVVGENWLSTMLEGLADNDLVRGRCSLDLLNDPATIAARGAVATTRAPLNQKGFGGLGGNCGFRRSAWEQLGGLRNHHHAPDDAEFFWRAHLEGLRIAYLDGAIVHYRLRPGFESLYQQQRSWASGRALLFREFGDTGLIERRSVAAAGKSWIWTAVHFLDRSSPDPARRGRWVRVHAANIGRLRGSLRHRVFFP
jgi:cellulose synthase/poly-beta-1,6-N-acetylglucosamine synthase-like glycosyltransferase